MSTLIILGAGVVVGYLARPGVGRRPFTPVDLGVGLVGGVIGLVVQWQFVASEGAWGLGLPLLVACGLALGLQSIQQNHTL
jgi:hypothetical protein